MDSQLAALRSLDTRMCADAHVELRRAVSCASDLFEANIKCLAQISRQQQDRNEERNRFREESEVSARRIRSLMSVVERQQGHIDALQKVCALGEVWSSVAAEFASSADPSVKFYRDTVNRCSTVMAWISVNCLKCISHDHHDEPVICEIGEDAFRIDVFAREVAAQLCAADTAVRARDAENALLRDRVRSLQTDLSSAQREAAHSRLSSERAAMDREDLHSAFSQMAAELRAERNRSERLQGSVSVLLRSVDDATADGDCWRAQCSAMSRTLGELVAAQSSLQPVAAQTMIDSRTGLSDKTDVVALALSLHPDYTTLSKGSDRQMCKMRGSHFHGDVLNKDVASDARNAAFNAKNESAVRPIETWIKGKNLSRGVSLLTGALEDTSASMVSGRDGDRRRGAIKMKNNWRDMHSTTAKSSNTIHGDITTFNNSTTAEFSTPGKVAVTARDFNRTPGSPFFPDGLSPIMFRWK